MALDMFLKIEGVDGEAQDRSRRGWIDVLAWSWGASQPGSLHTGGRGGAGRPNFQDLSLTKYIDKSSPRLLERLATGKHFGWAVLVVRQAGEKPLEYLRIDMEQVIVSSVSTGGSGGEDRLTENISLNFGAYELQYVPRDATGAPRGPVESGWDIAAGRPATLPQFHS